MDEYQENVQEVVDDEDQDDEDQEDIQVMLHPSMSMCVCQTTYRRLGWAWGGQLTMLRA